jgi:hypothetical protein
MLAMPAPVEETFEPTMEIVGLSLKASVRIEWPDEVSEDDVSPIYSEDAPPTPIPSPPEAMSTDETNVRVALFEGIPNAIKNPPAPMDTVDDCIVMETPVEVLEETNPVPLPVNVDDERVSRRFDTVDWNTKPLVAETWEERTLTVVDETDPPA